MSKIKPSKDKGLIGLPGGSDGRESDYTAGHPGLITESEDSLEKGMATHTILLSGEFHGKRSLEGDSPWGCTVRHN